MFSNGGKRRKPRGIHFEIIPMIDVMMILVLFLSVMAFLPQVKSAIVIDNPGSGSAEELNVEDLVVSINLNRAMYVNGDMATASEMLDKLDRASNGDKNRRIVIDADKGLPYEEIVTILSALQTGGYRNVALATQKD
ncbi:MAG: hypothetical protein CVV27_11535 [Candidatus Melainabacteria bacterium HGW-Melainabacteria-1]|nr:MAG: hypothetical protein CVV27_11535 [Candidatus Melainabacteria bacterium HGW-Melainabacteria-1]